MSRKGNLWIEKISEFTKFSSLGEKLFGDRGKGPYLFLLFFWILNASTVPLTAREIFDGYVRILIYLIGLSAGIWALKKLDTEYNKVSDFFNLADKSVSMKLKIFIFISGLVFYFSYVTVGAGVIANPLTGEYVKTVTFGFSAPYLLNYFIFTFAYLPIIAEFAAYFLHIHLVFPFQFKNEKPDLDFSDLERFGGTQKIGSLLLLSSKFYFALLTIYTFVPVIFPEMLGPGSMAFFIGAWVLGIVLFFLPTFIIHIYIRNEKKKKFRELEKEVEKAGREGGGRFEVKPEDQSERTEYIFLYLEHEHVYDTSEWPLDPNLVQQLVFTVSLPLALQLAFTFVF